MATVNLWPVEVANDVGIEGPTVVLKEQAILLGQMTKNLVEAYVEGDTDRRNPSYFVDNFILVSSVVNYRYTLFSIRYSARLYPAAIHWNGYSDEFVHADDGDEVQVDGIKQVFSRDELEKELQRIFSDSETVRLIQALISRART